MLLKFEHEALHEHLLSLPIRRMRVPRVDLTVALCLIHLIILRWDLATSRCISDRRQLRTTARRIARSLWLARIGGCRFTASIGGAGSVLLGFPVIVFLLLTLFPLFANFFKLW